MVGRPRKKAESKKEAQSGRGGKRKWKETERDGGSRARRSKCKKSVVGKKRSASFYLCGLLRVIIQKWTRLIIYQKMGRWNVELLKSTLMQHPLQEQVRDWNVEKEFLFCEWPGWQFFLFSDCLRFTKAVLYFLFIYLLNIVWGKG